ncbi:MAG: ribosome hibernation-promoting factor, HPF/YfiA family [bacterium]
MQINVTARQCEIGPELRAFAQTRLEKLAKYDAGIHEIRVIVSHERKLHTVELTLHAHHHDTVITESHLEPGAALELAADRLEEAVRRSKDKRVNGPRREGRGEPAAPTEGE